MKGFQYKFLVFLLLFLPEVLYCQSKITVTKPRLEVSDENLVISYDILNTKSSDFFIVWIEVTDIRGNKINAISVEGDVGKDIMGGKNKRITWKFGNDSIFVDEDLLVQVNAEKIAIKEETAETKTTKENEVKENAEIQGEIKTDDVDMNKELPENKVKTEQEEEKRTPLKEEGSAKEISKGKMVLTSTILPGWGQTKAKNGKPFWLIGAAGYGCIAGSVLMNRSASSAYDDYKSSMDPDESNTLFDKATRRNSFSKVLGYSAIGIWAADIIWVLVAPVKSQEASVLPKYRRLRIVPGIETGTNMALVSLTYTF